MEHEIEKKIKDLKEFIKQKTDQGTANYLGKELRKLCGMVEMEALRIHDVVGRSEPLPSCDKCGYYIHPENKTCLREGCENY
jgi:peptide subunit release factor 1 (eRF1)